MAGEADMQELLPILKDIYLPIRKKGFPLQTVLVAQMSKGSKTRLTYGGNDLFFMVKLSRRAGFNASNLGYTADPKIVAEKRARLGISRLYSMVSVDGLALAANKGSREGYISTAKKVTEDVMDEWKLQLNRLAHGDSLGIRATITAVNSTTSVTVANPLGITGAGPGNLHLVETEDISVRDSTGATLRGKTQISNISPLSGDTVTLTYNTAVAGQQVGDVIVSAVPASTHATDDSFGAEPHGIKSFVDAEGAFNTFQGVADDRWVAQKLSSVTVDEDVITQLLMLQGSRGGVDWVGRPQDLLLLTTPGIWKKYANSLLGMRRFSGGEMELKGGFTGVKVANATLVPDNWCPRGRIYSLYTPELVYIDLKDFDPVKYDDSPTWNKANRRDHFEMTFGTYMNMGTYLRAVHGVITGISDPTNFSPVY